MKFGSKYDLLDTPCIWTTNKFTEVNDMQSFEKIQWVDFTKYALSTIIH